MPTASGSVSDVRTVCSVRSRDALSRPGPSEVHAILRPEHPVVAALFEMSPRPW